MSEKTITNEKAVEETVKNETPKKTTTTRKTTSTTATKPNVEAKVEEAIEVSNELDKLSKENEELKNANIELQKSFEDLTAKFAQMMEITNKTLQNNTPQQTVLYQPNDKKYRITHLLSDHNICELETTRGKIVLRGYLDFKEVTEDDFREIVGRYHNLFAIGALTTNKIGAEILKDRKIRVANIVLSRSDMDNIHLLSVDELTELYNSLHPRQKEKLISLFIEGINLGLNDGFKDYEKIIALNKIYTGEIYKQKLKDAILKISE